MRSVMSNVWLGRGLVPKIEEMPPIQMVSYLEAQAPIEDKDKILIYPKKIQPTEERKRQISLSQQRRRDFWTRESIADQASEWLPNVSSKYRDDVLDLLFEYRDIFV